MIGGGNNGSQIRWGWAPPDSKKFEFEIQNRDLKASGLAALCARTVDVRAHLFVRPHCIVRAHNDMRPHCNREPLNF